MGHRSYLVSNKRNLLLCESKTLEVVKDLSQALHLLNHVLHIPNP